MHFCKFGTLQGHGYDPIHSFWITVMLGFPHPGPCILWYLPWLTQASGCSKDDDWFRESLTALEQFWAWSNTEYYCLISHLWWRHSGKKMQLDIPSGIAVAWSRIIFRLHRSSCKVVKWKVWNSRRHSLWNSRGKWIKTVRGIWHCSIQIYSSLNSHANPVACLGAASKP